MHVDPVDVHIPARLVLSDCGVMDNVVHISVGDEVQFARGQCLRRAGGKADCGAGQRGALQSAPWKILGEFGDVI